MNDVILHHYPESPFSEKIRLILAYKGVAWCSVVIPVIMPKPDLIPLTGGYRKTPVMQIGANVYCDSAMIARELDRRYPQHPVLPAKFAAAASAMAAWTDTFFFKVAVAMAFQPRALAGSSLWSDPQQAAAFAADRAELTKGSTALAMPLEQARPYFIGHLARLDEQFKAMPYLFGAEPLIADFSTYHCLWFIHKNEALRDVFSPFAALNQWMMRMSEMGPGESVEMTGSAALAIARETSPVVNEDVVSGLDEIAVGSDVVVTPIDYGFNPVVGRLVVANTEELVLLREDESIGQIAVHFPRLGFNLAPA